MSLPNNTLEKLLSGRFIFTIVCAGVFAYLSVTQVLPMDKVFDVILICFYAYFTKPRT